MYPLFSLRSNKQVRIISLSDITPNARININKGTGFRTFGTATTNCPFSRTVDGAMIFTEVVRNGLDASSETERTSAE